MSDGNYQIKVTNKNRIDLEDRFDGIRYVLPANGVKNVPYEAACHIFGVDFAPDEDGLLAPDLRKEIFAHLQRRWGWNRVKGDQGKSFFDNLDFKIVSLTLVENAVIGSVDHVPAPRAVRQEGQRGGKLFTPEESAESKERAV